MDKKFEVYILYSQKAESFYIGQTGNLNERLKRHQSGLEKFTARFDDLELIWKTEKPTRAEAMKLEEKIKNLSVQRLLEFMLKYEVGVAGPDELLLIKQLSGC